MIGGGQGRQARDLQAAVHDHRVLSETIGLLMAVHDCNAERATPGPAARPDGEVPPR
jgi:hypothetical protein